jgi:hypothetical protein
MWLKLFGPVFSVWFDQTEVIPIETFLYSGFIWYQKDIYDYMIMSLGMHTRWSDVIAFYELSLLLQEYSD